MTHSFLCEAIVVLLDSEAISALLELSFSSVLCWCVEVVFQGAFVHTLSDESHLKSRLFKKKKIILGFV